MWNGTEGMNTQELLKFIKKSTSPYHTVMVVEKILKAAKFHELAWGRAWKLKAGGAYFVSVFGSALMAFRIGREKGMLRIAAAHTDFPGFRVKPTPDMKEGGCLMLNVEPYGGLIQSSWLDRPLSIAGSVALRGKDAFHPVTRYVDFGRPLLTIPRLAIHMDRKVNDGEKLNRQTEMLPLAALDGEEISKEFFLEQLAGELDCRSDDILSYDLTVYACEEPCVLGFDRAFISASRLDNLTSVKACMDALLDAKTESGITVAAMFDNEEVGSRTKQGANSALLDELLRKIYESLGRENERAQDIAQGFLLSVDVAHGWHPNYSGKADPTNRPKLGGGFAIKQAASQSYVGDAEAQAVVKALADEAFAPYQTYVNRSDIPGGSTLGSLVSANLCMRGQDIGVPMLAMHSARELMAATDQEALTDVITKFFT